MFPSMDKTVIETVVDQFKTLEASMNALLSLSASDNGQPKLPQGRIPPIKREGPPACGVCQDEFNWSEPNHICPNQSDPLAL